MRTQRMTKVILAASVAVMALSLTAGAQGMMGVIQHAEHGGPEVVAAAVLSPVGSVDAWGRIAIMDRSTADGVVREAGIMAYGLEPGAIYTALTDGVELATFQADAAGTAEVRLEDGDDSHPPVPADVPPTDQLVNALVVDENGAAVLEGTFSILTPASGPDDTVYQETIPLLDVTGGVARGMARVERDADDSQTFETRAAGLEAGTQYQIVVDGNLAGVVTADAQGYAELALEAPDDENPLPETLQPVEDLRLVEWQLLDGTAVLSGSFTGTPNGGGDGEPGDGDHGGSGDALHSIHGIIAAFVDGGFELQAGMAVVTVVVDDQTQFEGFSSLDELQVGSMVEVEGSLAGSILTAARIELMNGGGGQGDDDGDQGGGGADISVHGMIASLVDGGFELQTPAGLFTVTVTGETIFDGFSGLDELYVGAGVEVEGTLEGSVITAIRIELMNGSGGSGDDGGQDGNEVSVRGMIVAFVDGGFELQNGMQVLTVQVTADTVFDGFSGLDELYVGAGVEVEGILDGSTLTATAIELMDGSGSGGHDGSGGDGDGGGSGSGGDGGSGGGWGGMF